MVKKLAILGFILVAVVSTGAVWAGTFAGAVAAPEPMVMPASAPACACGAGGCPPPPVQRMVQPRVVKTPCKPKKLTTAIQVKMQYPAPQMPACAPVSCGPPPIPVAVPMWKFIVPWPPFVYYLPVE
ncbi:MAG: hypothetical protein ACP5VS_14695 [Desulfomonilaceae bacterium]